MQQAGAIAVIVHNYDSRQRSRLRRGPTARTSSACGARADLPSTSVTRIPSTFVAAEHGLLFVDNVPELEGFVQLVALNRDSDLDAGVIVHEYGHGVSNRLTGGPSAAGCLTGDEQMGEGWSDCYGLMMTMHEDDEGETGRGIGTYVQFEDIDGPGIRTYRYSTDLSCEPAHVRRH